MPDITTDDGCTIHAEIEGRPFVPSPDYQLGEALRASMNKDHELLRCYTDMWSMLALQREIFARPGVREQVVELGSDWLDEPLPGLTREELLAIVND